MTVERVVPRIQSALSALVTPAGPANAVKPAPTAPLAHRCTSGTSMSDALQAARRDRQPRSCKDQ